MELDDMKTKSGEDIRCFKNIFAKAVLKMSLRRLMTRWSLVFVLFGK